MTIVDMAIYPLFTTLAPANCYDSHSRKQHIACLTNRLTPCEGGFGYGHTAVVFPLPPPQAQNSPAAQTYGMIPTAQPSCQYESPADIDCAFTENPATVCYNAHISLGR